MLDSILNPKTVAVIGASDAPGRIGGRPIHMMLEGGFGGKIFPVNPNRSTIQGLKSYAHISEVPLAIDCAIIAVPAKIALTAVQDCATAGVKALVMFTSGFAEIDTSGEAAQDEIAAIARSSGMRILGPNCLGVFNLRENWYATFANVSGLTRLPPGPVGIVTQSGAYGAHVYVAAQLRGVGANYWVTTGNEVDIDVAEVIEYYVQAPDVKVIVAYAEGMKNPERIRNALAAARTARKPVIFMKVGRTAAGAVAAASHTASLAGADAVYGALFKQYGAYRAETTEELVDIAYVCQFGRFPAGRKVSLQTVSGGVGVHMADAAVGYGLDVAPIPAATQAKIKTLMPLAGPNNPVDFTGQAVNQPEVMEQCVRLSMDDCDFDAHIIYLAGATNSPFLRDVVAATFQRLRDAYEDEVLFMCSFRDPEINAQYEQMGYPYFEDPSLAVRGLAGLMHFGEVFARGEPQTPSTLALGAMAAPTQSVSEVEAKRILASAGIPVVAEQLVNSAEQACAFALTLGTAVVMKIASPDIPHKTEIGGVLVNVDGAGAVAQAYATLLDRAQQARPDAQIDGVVVAPMIEGGVETVLGVVRDPLFGPAVMFGLGGVFVEVLKDVTFRLAPFGEDEARRMIDEIQGRAMLDGVRGAAPVDIDALAKALANLSVFAAANADTIESIDINPFIVLPNGAVAVDALIVPITGR